MSNIFGGGGGGAVANANIVQTLVQTVKQVKDFIVLIQYESNNVHQILMCNSFVLYTQTFLEPFPYLW